MRLCAALLIGFAAVVAFAVFDQSRRATLEQVVETTAVGDLAFFQPPAKFDSGAVLVKFRGAPLHQTGTARYPLNDGRMIREGMDDAKAVWVYRSLERGGRTGDYLFLKVAPGQYLEVSRERVGE